MCGSQVVVTSYNLGLSGSIEQTNVAPLNPSGFFFLKKKGVSYQVATIASRRSNAVHIFFPTMCSHQTVLRVLMA